ncbi:unnamed protein product [Effrenium voratum]|nr:unnamed protein product [Effrenium voratum]
MSGCTSQVKICEQGGGGIILPLLGEAEQEWRKGLRAVLYLLGLLWLFLAVATVSDIFMSAIEEITSKKKRVWNSTSERYFTVKVWNDTVANLTLMALGSSAPEILLSVIELLGNGFFSGDLGPSTIVGSAAFNLFCISAVCVMAIPDNEIRKIKDVNVYIVTAVISLLAYLWLYVVVSVISEDIVEIFEGILTFFFFPLLVGLAFAADKGYLAFIRSEVSPQHKAKFVLTDEDVARLGKDNGWQISDEELNQYLTSSQRMSKAAYRKRALGRLLHGKHEVPAAGHRNNFSAVVPSEGVQLPAPPGPVAPPPPQSLILFGSENFVVLESVGLIRLPICRTGNLSLTVMVDYECREGLAKAKDDYEAVQGTLVFLPDEVEKIIEVKIMQDEMPEDNEDFYVDLSNPRCKEFRVILSEPTHGATFDANTDGGAESCIVTVMIVPNQVSKDIASRTMRALGVNWQKTQRGNENWKEQFSNALLVNGGDDEAGPASGIQWCLHILTLPWKLFFAIIPPVDYCGGWLCFFISLVFIGMVTALVSDLAGLVGCVLDMPDFVTAITLVALGTSLPDTFASKAAAEQDPFADASIGNVTGSNSVNVFLGLGLPWAIGSIYWAVMGRTEEWQAKYAGQAKFESWDVGDGKFIVIGGDLGYSVVIFSSGAFITIFLLFLRRKAFGGELGGPRIFKQVTAVALVMVWVVYVALSSAKSLESASAANCR